MSEDDLREKPASSGADAGDSAAAGEAGADRAPLPSWNRTRTKRREKKVDPTDDAFTRSVRGAGVAAVKQGRLVALGVAGLVAVIAGGVYAYQQQAETDATASRAVARVAALQARAFVGDQELLGFSKEAVPPNPVVADEAARRSALVSALDELASADAPGPITDLLAASAAMRDGKADDALSKYEAFLGAVAADHALAFLAHEGVVLAKEAAGDRDGALARLAELLDAPGHYSEARAYYRDVLLSHRGRLLEASERLDEATAVYRQIHDEFDLNDTDPGLADEFVRGRLEALDPGALIKADPVPTLPAADDGGGEPAADAAADTQTKPEPGEGDGGESGEP